MMQRNGRHHRAGARYRTSRPYHPASSLFFPPPTRAGRMVRKNYIDIIQKHHQVAVSSPDTRSTNGRKRPAQE